MVEIDVNTSHTTFLDRPCPLCGERTATVEAASTCPADTMTLPELRRVWSGFFKEKTFFSYARCTDCGLLYTPTFFTEAQLGELYASLEPNMHVVPDRAIDATQRGYFDAAASAGTLDGGYLEIGPDVGHVTRHAAREGKFDHFWLFEPNRAVHGALADACAGRPHTISTSMTDMSAVPDGSVGLAVMVHVLDHLLDPVGMMEQLRAKLRPGGAVAIVTHDEASWLRRVMGTKWPPFCLQHPEIYNPRSIRRLVAQAGYASARVERSRNYFPVDFMLRQAATLARVNLDKVPLPRFQLGLKLGNMMTIAHR